MNKKTIMMFGTVLSACSFTACVCEGNTPTDHAAVSAQWGGRDQEKTTPLAPSTVKQTASDEKRDSGWLKGMTVKQFFLRLQNAVNAEDRKTAVRMMNFPMGVYLDGPEKGGFYTVIRSEKDFLDQYDRIITKRIRNSMKNEFADHLFVSWRGVELGRFWMLRAFSADEQAAFINQICYFRR